MPALDEYRNIVGHDSTSYSLGTVIPILRIKISSLTYFLETVVLVLSMMNFHVATARTVLSDTPFSGGSIASQNEASPTNQI